MITLITNANVYAPASLGRKDILIADRRIAAISDHIDPPAGLPTLKILDAEGRYAVPGFIDAHVHICGGGGEGGFRTRTPEITLTDLIEAGVTTVVGTLGTDGTTRTMENLLAKAYALEEEGVSAYTYTGSYRVPPTTLTGSVRRDIILIPKILGVGEIAISDHRSSQPTVEELTRLVADARVAGILSGKAGIVNFHVGAGSRMLDKVEMILRDTEIPISQFYPTHLNRSADLLDRAKAFARRGGYVDLTTSSVRRAGPGGSIPSSTAFRLLRESQVPGERITFTSDGQGSLPSFDKDGNFLGLEVGKSRTLFDAFRDTVREEGIPPEEALLAVTANPARILKLGAKGNLEIGSDADLLLLDDTWAVNTVMARGRILAEEGVPIVRGTFE